jgi:hypothetical protein
MEQRSTGKTMEELAEGKNLKQLIKVVDTFDAPIDQVWAVVAAVGAEKAWMPALKTCALKGAGVGAIRTMTFETFAIIERIETCDPDNHFFVYRLLDPAEGGIPSPIPAEGSIGTIKLTELGPDKTQIDWVSWAEKITGSTADVIGFMEPFYKTSIANIKTFISR